MVELDRERLQQAIDALPEPTVRMLVLAVNQRLTYTDIATRIGWPAPKVASEMRRSLRILREQAS
jgi:DNA-directed RNA polymerase specialized sigma24 family protein